MRYLSTFTATLALFTLLASTYLPAQVTLIVHDVPEHYTPLLDDIFVAGTFNNWTPGDPQYRMTKNANGTYSIQLNGTPGQTVEYKYTRGNWQWVETRADGSQLPNRSFVYSNFTVLNDTVQDWEDTRGIHTAAGNLHLLDVDFYIPQLNRFRRIWAYLPQDYYTSTRDYPVLYMHDGQELFDTPFTSYNVEWRIDENMEMLQDSGYPPAIVIGIDHGHQHRLNELAPWTHVLGGGEGAQYMQFVTNTLKPFVDSYFRTNPARSHTALMGSSLGGLISLYGGLERQDIFSKLGVFSPSFWTNDSCYTHAANQGRQYPMRIYMLGGGMEGANMVANMYKMEDTLLAHGFSANEVISVAKADGQHMEWFWDREFPAAYQWLFADLLTSRPAPVAPDHHFALAPSVVQDFTRLHTDAPDSEPVTVQLFNLQGNLQSQAQLQAGDLLDLRHFPNGIYIAEIRQGQQWVRTKILVRH